MNALSIDHLTNVPPNGDQITADKPVEKKLVSIIKQGFIAHILADMATRCCTKILARNHNPFIALCLSAANVFPLVFTLHKLNPTIPQGTHPTQQQRLLRIAINTLKYATIGLGMLSVVPSSPVLLGLAASLAIFDEVKPLTFGRALLIYTGDLLMSAGAYAFSIYVGCPAQYIPTQVLDPIGQLSEVNIYLREKVIRLLGMPTMPWTPFKDMSLIEVSIVGPVMEEVFSRGIVQELLLRRIPRMILNQFAPSHAWIVDSTPCKVARVTVSAALFALMHTRNLSCEMGGGLPQFFGGLINSYQTEVNGNILASTQSHIMFNSLSSLLATAAKSLGG